jgi:hypothetical protein
MDEKAIALIGETSVTVWDFPRLSGNAQGESLKPQPSAPAIPRASFHFPPEAGPNQNCRCSGLCDWYTGSPQPLMFDLQERTWTPLYFELFRFEVSLQSPLQAEDQLLFTPNSPIRLPRTTPPLAHRTCCYIAIWARIWSSGGLTATMCSAMQGLWCPIPFPWLLHCLTSGNVVCAFFRFAPSQENFAILTPQHRSSRCSTTSRLLGPALRPPVD